MFQTRPATPTDAPLITHHRRAMFEAMASGTPAIFDAMTNAFEPWVRTRLANGRYLGWITTNESHPIASIGLLFLDWPPHVLHPSTHERAYILNMFVEPPWRRRGVARALIDLCLAEARRRNIVVTSLHASAQGRPLYESLGFTPSNEMQLIHFPPD